MPLKANRNLERAGTERQKDDSNSVASLACRTNCLHGVPEEDELRAASWKGKNRGWYFR